MSQPAEVSGEPSKSIGSRFYLILTLGMLTAIGPFSIDMYLPAFPDIAKSLDTSVAQVMLSLSSYFVGVCIGQLLYGPLLERYGRKRPLYFGLAIYLAASVGCAMAASVNALILFRFMQALGGCVGMVAARAIVRDVFDVSQNARVFSTLMLVVAVSPIVAPTLGGYVTAAYGWRIVFVVLMAVAALILLGVCFLLPESKKPDSTYSLRPSAILSGFTNILKNPQFYTYALTTAVAYGGLCAYISGSPNVFMEVYEVSEQVYGWIFAIIAVGIISASQVNNLALRKYSSQQIIRASLVVQCLIGLSLAVLALLGQSGIYTTIFLIFCFLSCQGFISPNASALSLAHFGHNAGSASALMGATQMGIGAAASAIVSLLQNGTLLPMAGGMACCAVGALSIYLLGSKIIVQAADLKAVEEEDVELISKL